MCEFGLALGLASTLMGAAGAVQQGQAASQAAEYNSKVSAMNADLADRRAKDALVRGQKEEQQKLFEKAQIMGKQKAAAAANGVDITFGSPLDNIVDTAKLGEIDALTIRQNANRESYDYRVQAVNQNAQSELQSMQADSAKTGGYLSAFGTLLGGAGDAYKYYNDPYRKRSF